LIITPGNIDVQIEVGELVQADLNTEQVYAIDPILPTPAGARSMDDEGGPPFLFNLGNTICSLDVLPISALRYRIFKPQNVLILLSNHQPHLKTKKPGFLLLGVRFFIAASRNVRQDCRTKGNRHSLVRANTGSASLAAIANSRISNLLIDISSFAKLLMSSQSIRHKTKIFSDRFTRID
jgi:hypothetical protein